MKTGESLKRWVRVRMSIILVSSCLAATAQTAPPEPEFADVFFRLMNGKLTPLERQATTKIKGSAHGFIVMSMKASSELKGGRSPVRFKAGDNLEFVVRSTVPAFVGIDPSAMYYLRRLNAY